MQLGLTLCLVLEMIEPVAESQFRVFFRVPDTGINAVEDAGQAVLPVTENAIQAVPVFRGLDFPGIFGADGGDPVTEHKAALDK